MDQTDNPEAPISPPRSTRLTEQGEGRVARRERGHTQQGAFGRMAQFLRDVRAEMRRVSWPSAANVKNTTVITLIAVIFFAVYLFAVDQALSRLIVGLDWLIEKVAKLLGVG